MLRRQSPERSPDRDIARLHHGNLTAGSAFAATRGSGNQRRRLEIAEAGRSWSPRGDTRIAAAAAGSGP